MENIEVGEFIRFKCGYIRKAIGRRYDNEILIDRHYKGYNFISPIEENEDVVKHSKDITDILEVGDIVELKIGDDWYEINKIVDKDIFFKNLKAKCIHSVLTHELYEANCYRLEE